jgi:hypothetical protein
MRRGTFALLLSLLAGPASAQVSNPFLPDGRDEGASQGRFNAINFVGVNVACVRSGLVFTCTISGPALAGTNAWAGQNDFIDTNFRITGSADATKIGRFEVDGNTTGATRIYTLPNANVTLVGLESGGTFTSQVNFNTSVVINNAQGLFMGSSATSAFRFNVTQNPDSPTLETGTASNSFNVFEIGDTGFNFANGPCGAAACVQPAGIIRSQNQSTTQYTAWQAGALTTRRNRTLTEAGGAEELFRVTTATLESGGGEIDYKIHVTDGTDFAVREGKIRFVFYNNAGTVTATISGADQTADGSVAIVSAGETLTYALAANVATANVFIFTINIDSNITVNAAHADYIVTYTGPGEVVFP